MTPEQVDAFEKAFRLNAPVNFDPNDPVAHRVDDGVISITEIYIGGLVQSTSTPATVLIEVSGDPTPLLVLPINLFGGLVRWAATPDPPLLVEGSRLRIRVLGLDGQMVPKDQFAGSMRYAGQDGVWRMAEVGEERPGDYLRRVVKAIRERVVMDVEEL